MADDGHHSTAVESPPTASPHWYPGIPTATYQVPRDDVAHCASARAYGAVGAWCRDFDAAWRCVSRRCGDRCGDRGVALRVADDQRPVHPRPPGVREAQCTAYTLTSLRASSKSPGAAPHAPRKKTDRIVAAGWQPRLCNGAMGFKDGCGSGCECVAPT